MSLGREHLEHAWRALGRQWDRTGEQWQDVVHDRFQREFWAEYERVVPAALGELSRLEEMLARVQREMPDKPVSGSLSVPHH